MSKYGLKIALPGQSVDKASITQSILSDGFPALKTDVTANPRHYGFLDVIVNNLAPGQQQDLLIVPHNLGYVPQFFAIWFYGPGSFASNGKQTFGTWFLEIDIDGVGSNIAECVAMADTKNFYITIQNPSANTATLNNARVQWRYYLFVENIGDTADS